MKKLSLLSAVCGLGFMGAASAADITIYYSPTCPHCHHARSFIEGTLIYEYPNLAVRTVDVTNGENYPLFEETLKKCEYESGGVPVMVIGEKCFQGYADFMEQELRDAVEVDLGDEDKSAAAANREAMKANADVFKSQHAERATAVSEYSAAAAAQEAKKNDSKGGSSSVWFYGLLIVLVAALGFVLIKKDNKKK